MLLRLSVIFPLALSIAAFVLSFLLVFAGHKDGFLEDYDLIRLNTSTLGHNLISGSEPEAEQDGDDDEGGIRGWFNDAKDDAADFLNDLGNEVADRLADELGISEWYSIHMMTLCRGEFEPNATAPGAGHNVTSCSDASPANRVNLTEVLDGELQAGPLSISLADINWPSTIDDAIEKVNKALLAIFVLYVLGIAFSGLAMLAAVAAFFLDPYRRSVSLVNLVFALLAALVLLAASVVVTIGGGVGADEITERGGEVGISAERGAKFMALSWAAFAVMAAALMYWAAVFCLGFRERRRQRRRVPALEKPAYQL